MRWFRHPSDCDAHGGADLADYAVPSVLRLLDVSI